MPALSLRSCSRQGAARASSSFLLSRASVDGLFVEDLLFQRSRQRVLVGRFRKLRAGRHCEAPADHSGVLNGGQVGQGLFRNGPADQGGQLQHDRAAQHRSGSRENSSSGGHGTYAGLISQTGQAAAGPGRLPAQGRFRQEGHDREQPRGIPWRWSASIWSARIAGGKARSAPSARPDKGHRPPHRRQDRLAAAAPPSKR